MTMFNTEDPDYTDLTHDDLNRFRANVKELNNDCSQWIGPTDEAGYGLFYLNGKMYRAHRIAFLIANRYIYSDELVRHGCDNKWCVSPRCLLQGDYADNSNDAVQRGRTRRGEDHPQSQLTEVEVAMIKASTEPLKELAKQFGVPLWKIKSIKLEESWDWLETETIFTDEQELTLHTRKPSKVLSREDIQNILKWDGDEDSCCLALELTHKQYRYVMKNYDSVNYKHNYRQNMEEVFYE